MIKFFILSTATIIVLVLILVVTFVHLMKIGFDAGLKRFLKLFQK